MFKPFSTVLLVSSACVPPVLIADPPPGAVSLRHRLGSREPRTLHRVKGVDLAVHDSDLAGNKPVLICLHAVGHGGSDFNALEDAFSATWRIITIDWPGQGASGPDPAPASAQRYNELLTGVIDQLRLERFVIIGNSIGGAAAMLYAAGHPQSVRALVLSNPGGLDPGGFVADLFIGSLIRHFKQGARREAAFGGWFQGYYDDILVTPEARSRKAAIVAAGYETAPVLVQAWESFRLPEHDLRPLIGRLQMPVWFAWAKRDGLIRWSRNKDAVAQFAHGEVEFFDAGHTPFLETSGPFNKSLAAFLGRVR